MLRNDINNSLGTIANAANTRGLSRAVERHHQNNPHSSIEAAFEYVMSNSSTFRALPAAYIEKARKYLGLPIAKDKPKSNYAIHMFPMMPLCDILHEEITPIEWSHTEIPIFNISGQLESMGISTTDEVKIKTKVSGPQVVDPPIYPGSKSMSRPKPKQGITKVHAERVVVNNRKMIKILDITGCLKGSDLPNEYIMGAPLFTNSIIHNVDLFIHPTDQFTDNCKVRIGDIMPTKEFDQMIKTMKEAAQRLTNINKKIKLKHEHSGKFTVSI